MTASLPFTGERFTPEARGAIWYEHWHRYCVVLPAVAGKRVLDAACGEGYGSALLARAASEVVGVDIDHFHVHELDRADLETMLRESFPQQQWYAQRALAHSLLWREGAMASRAAEFLAFVDGRIEVRSVPAPPMYFLVVCGDAEAVLPDLPALSVFDDGALSLYRDYERALLAEKRLFWDQLDARKIAEARLAELVAALNELGSSRQRGEALSSRVTSLEGELRHAQAAFARVSGALDETSARLAFRESWLGWLRWALGRVRRLLAGSRR